MENLTWSQRKIVSTLPFSQAQHYSELLLSSEEIVLLFALILLNPKMGFKYTFETIIIHRLYLPFSLLASQQTIPQKSAFVKQSTIQCHLIPCHKTFKKKKGKTPHLRLHATLKYHVLFLYKDYFSPRFQFITMDHAKCHRPQKLHFQMFLLINQALNQIL